MNRPPSESDHEPAIRKLLRWKTKTSTTILMCQTQQMMTYVINEMRSFLYVVEEAEAMSTDCQNTDDSYFCGATGGDFVF